MLKTMTRLVGLLFAFAATAALTGVVVSAAIIPLVLPGAALTREASRYYLELPDRVEEPPLPQRSVMRDADGNVFATFQAYDRIPVKGSEISAVMRKSVVAVEDKRFYEHNGYDPIGILRALASNSTGSSTQGASTITQQYIKNVLALQAELGSEDPRALGATDISADRKLTEIRIAVALTRSVPKDELLTRYLNIAYFGSGAYGIEAAARRYFSVPASELTAPQSAVLTSLLKNPTGYDPLKYPQVARERRDIVLAVMAREGVIGAAAARRFARAPLGLRPSTPKIGCAASTYPFYCEEVLSELRNNPVFGRTPARRLQLLSIGGLDITTPLSPSGMRIAEEAAKSTVPPDNRVATAVAVVQPGTGEVVAMGSSKFYGSLAPTQTQLVLPTRKAFQPGSTFKMFTLAAALDAGLPYSTRLPGGATHTSRVFANPPKGFYSNSAGSESNVTLERAAQLSMNTAFVQLEEIVGIRAVAEMARKLGLTSTGPDGPGAPGPRDGSYTLGTASVSVVEMANAYATIAAGGIACKPTFITRVVDASGRELASPAGQCERVIDEAAADSVAAILATVVSQGTGKPAFFGRPVAGKTGTTENLGAAWFAGFTPQFASAVWVGDPRGPSYSLYNVLGYSRVYGGTLPATVWRKTMAGVHEGLPVLPMPKPDPSYVATSSGELLPNIVGMSAEQAQSRLLAAGVQEVVVTRVRPEDGQPRDAVVQMSPAAGSAVPDEVTISVTR